MSDICNLIISNSLKEIQTKIDEAEMKAKAFKPHLKVLAMISIGFARRTYLGMISHKMSLITNWYYHRIRPYECDFACDQF